MDLRDNYIVKSVTSRPVVSSLIALLSCILTYQLMSGGMERRDKEISSLKMKVTALSQESYEETEEYDPKTGKLIKKKIKKDSKKETSESKETYKSKESSTVSSKSNSLYVGYGYDIDTLAEPVYYFGYHRHVWFVDLGILLNTNQSFGSYGVAGTLGISF